MKASKLRRAATDAVLAEMSARRWTLADLAREAGIDRDTGSDFLSGKRWPQASTRGRIEQALSWPSGTIQAVRDGADPPPISDPQVIYISRPDGLTDAQWGDIRRTVREFAEFQIQRAARQAALLL